MAIKRENGFLRRRHQGGNWHFCIYLDGRLWERSTGEKDKRRAEAKALELAKTARVIKDRGAGGPKRLSEATVREVSRIEEEVSAEQANRVFHALKAVGETLGDLPLEKIDAAALDKHQRARSRAGKASDTIAKEICYIRRLLRQNGFHVDKPKSPPVRETPCRAFTPEEIREFVQASDTYPENDPGRYTPLWLIMAATGARPAEMVPSPRSTHKPLLKSEIDLESCTVTLRSAKQRAGKRGKTSRVKVARPILEAVAARARKVPGPYVFREMGRLCQDFNRILAKTSIARVDETGQKVTAHSFRHYFATQVAQSGANAFVLMNVLRHADARMTSRYTEAATAAVEIDLSDLLIAPVKSDEA